MSAREVQNLLQRRLDLWSSGEVSRADALFADDYVMHGPEGDMEGVEPFKRIVAGFHHDLPDLEIHYEHVVIGEDQVAYVWKIQGTHQGSKGPDGGGRRVMLSGAIVIEVEGGLFVEEWRSGDPMGLLVQLGVISAGKRLERMLASEDSRSSQALH